MDANEQRIDAHLARVDDDAGREPDRVTCCACERTVPIDDTTVYGTVESAGLCGPVVRTLRRCHRCTQNWRIWWKHHRDDKTVYRPAWAYGARR